MMAGSYKLGHSLPRGVRACASRFPALSQRIRLGYVQLRWRTCRLALSLKDENGHFCRGRALFIAGLPKSGTSWLESMAATYAGYPRIIPPGPVRYELKKGGSHDYDLSEEFVDFIRDRPVVTKLHVGPTDRNRQILKKYDVKFVVMFRDLRDVAISHYKYVSRTPWHPEHTKYRDLSIEEALWTFSASLLPAFAWWIRGWLQCVESDRILFVKYETLVDETRSVFRNVLDHFACAIDEQRVTEVVDSHAFSKVSGGRERGTSDKGSFLRKGVDGEWKDLYSYELRERFWQVAGPVLDEVGYGP